MPTDLVAPTAVPPDSAASVWAAVAGHLEQFAAAWGMGSPPDIKRFLPDGPPAVRQLTLGELVKIDLEHRLQRGQGRPLESYFKLFPELAPDGVPPCDLLYEDYHLRKRFGEAVNRDDYFARFPGRATELDRLLGNTVPSRTTSAFAVRAPVKFKPGDTIDDFDLLAELGAGTFATVFLARQRGMQRLVALKVSARPAAEAETLAQLDHPHIVRVYDQRFVADPGVQLVYMPALPGGTLGNVLAQVRATPPAARTGKVLLQAVDAALDRRGDLPPAQSAARAQWAARTWPAAVAALGAKLAGALDYAHRQGVLHRDLKPANVLLSAEGEPLLADFNVGSCSKVDGAGPEAFFGGSLAYMAPEHLEAFRPDHPRDPGSLDGRADLFGLAVTLWELLTGGRPYGKDDMRDCWPDTVAALTAQRRAGVPAATVAAAPSDGAPGLPEVLARCLAADPADRPATAADVAGELGLCLRPATRALVCPRPAWWRAWVRRWPLLALAPSALVPNFLASLFNIMYNQEIVNRWGPAAQVQFDRVIPVVNGVFFPLGIGTFAWALRPVAHALAGLPADAAVRRRSLQLGNLASLVCTACWLVAGVVWPALLRLLAGPPPEEWAAYGHFAASLTVSGLMSAVYPYFLVTFVVVRVIYPALLGRAGPQAADAPALAAAERELGRYRLLAAAVPLVAVTVLAVSGTGNTVAVAVLSATGLAGSLLAFVLEGRIRADLKALNAE